MGASRLEGIERLRADLTELARPGVAGEFGHVDLLEIVATPPGGSTINVLTVAVLSETEADHGTREVSDARPIRVEGFRGWAFGVARGGRRLTSFDDALARYANGRPWAPGGAPLGTGDLVAQPSMFAPPDGTETVPLNGVLKNNFWAGSHVLRLADLDKGPFGPFFVDRRRLQALSDAVSRIVPIAFAGLADLLGDIIVQVPVTVVVPRLASPQGGGGHLARLALKPGAERASLIAAARTRWDGLLVDAVVGAPLRDGSLLPIDGGRLPVETEIADAATGGIVAATAPTSVLRTVTISGRTTTREPRLFQAQGPDGCWTPQRVRPIRTTTDVVGEGHGLRDAAYWLGRRQRLEEAARLAETRDFVQYRPSGDPAPERARALADILHLVDEHGEGGVDLWDPFLSAGDLLRTLFRCVHADVPLRALTAGAEARGREAEDADAPTAPSTFRDRQRSILEERSGNRAGLRLEYRTSRGPHGRAFHDRFLIFPGKPDGPVAWSLGTSVNGLGKAHHILQRVLDGALVAGAFEDLWHALDGPAHAIWRSW